eukprot:1094503-Amphidinium_carterae.1
MLLLVALLFLVWVARHAEAVVLPDHFNDLVPNCQGGSIGLGAANFNTILQAIGSDQQSWSLVGGGTSNDIRRNLIKLVTSVAECTLR